MLAYNEVKEREYIVLDGNPYEVLSSHVFRKQQRKPVNQTKLKNLISGKVVEQTFHQTDKIERAEIKNRDIKYLFHKFNRQKGAEEYWFSSITNPGDRFEVEATIFADQLKFLKPNDKVTAMSYSDSIIGIKLPIKMQFKVTEAPPNIKGNTAQGGNKAAMIETGASVTVPLFVEVGDSIIVNTQTGEYAERARE